MKKFLIILGFVIVAFFLGGMVVLNLQFSKGIYLLPLAMLLFAIWVPLFLFYAYDRKQRKKEIKQQND